MSYEGGVPLERSSSSNSTDSIPELTTSSELPTADTTALTTPNVELSAFIADRNNDALPLDGLKEALNSVANGPIALNTRIPVTNDVLPSTQFSPTAPNRPAVTGVKTIKIISTETISSSTAGTPSSPSTPVNKPALTKLPSPLPLVDPLSRTYDTTTDANLSIEELLARRPQPGPLMRTYLSRPRDEEREKREMKEDFEEKKKHLKAAAEGFAKLPMCAKKD